MGRPGVHVGRASWGFAALSVEHSAQDRRLPTWRTSSVKWPTLGSEAEIRLLAGSRSCMMSGRMPERPARLDHTMRPAVGPRGLACALLTVGICSCARDWDSFTIVAPEAGRDQGGTGAVPVGANPTAGIPNQDDGRAGRPEGQGGSAGNPLGSGGGGGVVIGGVGGEVASTEGGVGGEVASTEGGVGGEVASTEGGGVAGTTEGIGGWAGDASAAGAGGRSPACGEGEILCAGECVDAQSADHCGTCDRVCPAGTECIAAECVCVEGLVACGDLCVDLKTDPEHCVACNAACDPGDGCLDGACVSGPCFGLCENPESMPRGTEGLRVEPLGATSRCFAATDYTAAAPRIVCWGFAAERTLAVNGEPIDCVDGVGVALGAERAGGYCIEVGEGPSDWAGILLPFDEETT